MTQYFESYNDARSVLEGLKEEFPNARTVLYEKGYAIQFYKSGPYFPDFQGARGVNRFREPSDWRPQGGER